MRKIFHFDSPADPYVADAAVLCLFRSPHRHCRLDIEPPTHTA